MKDQETVDLRYLAKAAHFLEQFFSVFGKYFPDCAAFDQFYQEVATDEKKNLFLRIGSFCFGINRKEGWIRDTTGTDCK